jgi:hypothetical protein
MPVHMHGASPHDPLLALLTASGHNPLRIIKVTTSGDMGDEGGEEVLFITNAPTPQVMVARVSGGRVLSTRSGW